MNFTKKECEQLLNMLSQTTLQVSATLQSCDIINKDIRPLLEKLHQGAKQEDKADGN